MKKSGSRKRTASNPRIPPHSGLMPQPWPATSPDHAKRIFEGVSGAVTKCPLTGSLNSRVDDSNCTSYKIRCPAGKRVSGTLQVKSDAAVVAGPTTRWRSPRSDVCQVTIMRDGLSVRDQMTPRPSVVSPAITPDTIRGRPPWAISGNASVDARKERLLARRAESWSSFIPLYCARVA